jgi:CheY-like chemotaxis protein
LPESVLLSVADGRHAFTLAVQERPPALLAFDSPKDTDDELADLARALGGVVVGNDLNGIVRLVTTSSVTLIQRRRWLARDLACRVSRDISRIVPVAHPPVLAALLDFCHHRISPPRHGATLLYVLTDQDDGSAQLRPEPKAPQAAIERPRPVVLTVDDNPHLVAWLERLLTDAGVMPLTAATAQQARDIARRQRLDVAIIDILASDGDGLWLTFELLRLWPQLQVVLMTGTELSPDEAALCDRQDFPVLPKPFLI